MRSAIILLGILIEVLMGFLLLSWAVEATEGAKSAAEWKSSGDEAFAEHDYEKAVEYYNNAVDLNPSYAEAWHNKGRALCKMNKQKEAEESFDKALKLDPQIAYSLPQDLCRNNQIDRVAFSNNESEPAFITWDFEVGNLEGWNTLGDAFDNQPIDGSQETDSLNHQGDFFILTGDNRTGAMTSKRFIINGDEMDFLLGGCSDCSVELLINGSAVLIARGNNTDTMEKVRWDTSAYREKEAEIRLIDNSSIGHMSFDDVEFDVPPTPVRKSRIDLF